MSRTLHTDPYPIRAARRVDAPVPVRVRPARPGFRHPAGPADIARVLEFLGPAAAYGLRRIELRQRPAHAGPVAVAALQVPGVVLLFEQPDPPWRLPGRLAGGAQRRVRRAGAVVTTTAGATLVEWGDGALRDFVLFDGLLHEVGHHAVQHAANKPRTPVLRTADHERRAEAFADRARAAWSGR